MGLNANLFIMNVKLAIDPLGCHQTSRHKKKIRKVSLPREHQSCQLRITIKIDSDNFSSLTKSDGVN